MTCMKNLSLILLVILAVWLLAGCGNVYLRGDAATACETSALDAYQAVQRSASQPTSPAWVQPYLQENYKQWRSFVQSNRKDTAWGPKLEGE